MSGFSLLSNILRQPWLIDQQYAQTCLAFIDSLLNGSATKFYSDTKEEMEAKTAPFAMGMLDGSVLNSRYNSYDEAPQGSVAIHVFTGPLMKEDADCGGPPGYETMSTRLIEADNHNNIAAHVLKTFSPGGGAMGLNTLLGAIRNLKKPVIGFVDDQSTSAAYGIVSSANLVIASSTEALVGSIGTQISMLDSTKRMEAMGLKMHTIRATKSFDKNESSLQVFENNYEPIRQEILDPLNDSFLANVQNNRKNIINLEVNNVFTGKVYTAKAGLTNGLVDEIGSFEYAVKRAIELSQKQADTNRTLDHNNMKMNTFLASMLVSLGFTSLSQKEELTEADFTQATEKITELTAQLQTANFEKADAIAKLEAVQTAITEKDAKITELESTVAEFDAVSGAARTGVLKNKDKDAGQQPPSEPSSWEEKASKLAEY
jgi:protease-4